MKIFFFSLLSFVLLISQNGFGQGKDSVNLKVDWGTESKELQDYYRFQNIDYFKVAFKGDQLKNSFYLLVSKEYWDGKLSKTDTVVNSRGMEMKIGENEFKFRVMAQKAEEDTVKFQFFFSNFSITKKFKASKQDTYSLRDISNNKSVNVAVKMPLTLFAYSLPYQDPKRPGWLMYCELSREGIPPEKWGEKFGVKHYIIFELKFLRGGS